MLTTKNKVTLTCWKQLGQAGWFRFSVYSANSSKSTQSVASYGILTMWWNTVMNTLGWMRHKEDLTKRGDSLCRIALIGQDSTLHWLWWFAPSSLDLQIKVYLLLYISVYEDPSPRQHTHTSQIPFSITADRNAICIKRWKGTTTAPGLYHSWLSRRSTTYTSLNCSKKQSHKARSTILQGSFLILYWMHTGRRSWVRKVASYRPTVHTSISRPRAISCFCLLS